MRGLVEFPTKTIKKRVNNKISVFNLRGIVGFPIEAIQERVIIEKVAPISVV